MDAVLSREYGNRETRGCLYVFEGDRSLLDVKVLELPEKGNAQNVSCIPAGKYPVEKIIRPEGDDAFHVKNVPGRSEILIHIGNFAAGMKVDTQGCILPGLRFVDINGDGILDIADSRKAMNLLLGTLPDKFDLHIL